MRRCPSPSSSDANPPDQEIPSSPELEAVQPLESIIVRDLQNSSPKGDLPSPPKTFKPPPSSTVTVSCKSGRPMHILHRALQPIDQTSLTAWRYPTVTRGLNCVISDADHQWYVPSPQEQFSTKVLYNRYCSMVKRPIYLAVIVERTERAEPYYASEEEALEDVRRVFTNAIEYHRASSFWFRAAQKLSAMFERNCAPKRRRSTTTPIPPAVKKKRLLKEVCVSKRHRPCTRNNPPANEFHFVVGRLNGRLYTSKCRQLSQLIHEQLPNITYDYVEGLMHSTRYDAFCATKGRKTVVGGLLCKAFREQDFIELCFLVVSTRFQRQGCGIALMDSLKKFARRKGIKWILTYADLTAKGFFRRCGFTKGTSLSIKAWEEEIYHYTRSELMSFQVI